MQEIFLCIFMCNLTKPRTCYACILVTVLTRRGSDNVSTWSEIIQPCVWWYVSLCSEERLLPRMVLPTYIDSAITMIIFCHVPSQKIMLSFLIFQGKGLQKFIDVFLYTKDSSRHFTHFVQKWQEPYFITTVIIIIFLKQKSSLFNLLDI